MTNNRLRELYYTEEEVADILGITVKALRNRHYAGKNHPPRSPEKFYPKDEFHKWQAGRLERARKAAS